MLSGAEVERFSPQLLARLCGLFTLTGILTGAFDIGYVHSTLFVAGNPAATFQNIHAHQMLFRLGFGAHLLLLLCNVPGEILFFFLFRRVNAVVAAVAMCCGLVGTAVEALDMAAAYVPLAAALDSGALAVFSADQLHALAYLSLQIQTAGLLISFIFYGLDEILAGSLIFRSAFLPRVIGLMLSLAGLCYLSDGFLHFLSPALYARANPYILFPCAPGEGATALWMAIAGINLARFRSWPSAPEK